MEIDQLRLFMAVARLSSMSRASEEMHISQSAVSQSIARLEAELGTTLFDRSKRKLIIKEEGEEFYHKVAKVLQDLDNACIDLKDRDYPQGMLRLLIFAGSALMPDLLSKFNQMYPDVRFQLTQHNASNEFDLCINYSPNGIPPENGSILLTEEVKLGVPASHPLAGRRAISLTEAASENFIMMRQGSALRSLADSMCKKAGFEPKVIFESDSPATVRSLMTLGLGTAFLPFISWNSILDRNIKPLHIETPRCERTLCIFSPKYKHSSAAMIAFRKFSIEYFRKVKQKILA